MNTYSKSVFNPHAIDHGFDWVNYPLLTPMQQVKSIPKLFLQLVEIEESEEVPSHKHPLIKRPTT